MSYQSKGMPSQYLNQECNSRLVGFQPLGSCHHTTAKWADSASSFSWKLSHKPILTGVCFCLIFSVLSSTSLFPLPSYYTPYRRIPVKSLHWNQSNKQPNALDLGNFRFPSFVGNLHSPVFAPQAVYKILWQTQIIAYSYTSDDFLNGQTRFYSFCSLVHMERSISIILLV